MTSSDASRGGLPAADQETFLDLTEKLVGVEPQAKQGHPQHGLAGDRQRVLTQGVADDVLRPRVVDTVDLDHEVELRPIEVEVVAVALVTTQHLPLGWWEP